MLTQSAEAGTPKLSLKWPKGTAIAIQVVKTDEGRFLCQVRVNDGEFFNLPGTHPTEEDARKTLDAYVDENLSE